MPTAWLAVLRRLSRNDHQSRPMSDHLCKSTWVSGQCPILEWFLGPARPLRCRNRTPVHYIHRPLFSPDNQTAQCAKVLCKTLCIKVHSYHSPEYLSRPLCDKLPMDSWACQPSLFGPERLCSRWAENVHYHGRRDQRI